MTRWEAALRVVDEEEEVVPVAVMVRVATYVKVRAPMVLLQDAPTAPRRTQAADMMYVTRR